MNGVLVVDKPAGPTSHDVVARLRRVLGESRIGHTGTLDPMATGVLALAIGRATRLVRFLTAADKTYEADIRLGHATDTYDVTGTAVARPGCTPVESVTEEAVESALRTFRGVQWQLPPPFSAKKIGGQRAHRLARRDRAVQPAAVHVAVSRLTGQLLERSVVRVELTCTAGFYVRALAHALGERLGTGAVLERLRRTRSGEFSLEGACGLPAIDESPERLRAKVIPMERLLEALPRATLTEAGTRRAGHGNSIETSDLATALAPGAAPPIRLFDATGALVAIAETGEKPGTLLPRVVLV